jgi:hypothetical protein
MLKKYLIILTLLVNLCSSATADTVLIDWSASTKVSHPAGDGKYWNSLGINNGGDLATTALVDVHNAASGISVAVDITKNARNEGSGFGDNGINFSQGVLMNGVVTVTGNITGSAIDQLFVDVAVKQK